MLSEDFDKKIRDAADHHHPAYDEKAWAGMKKLLDKHLPEEKVRKRRFIFILLFPLLLAGGAWLLFDRLNGDNKTSYRPVAAETQKIPAEKTTTVPAVAEPAVPGTQTDQPGNTENKQPATGLNEGKPGNLVTTNTPVDNRSANSIIQEDKPGLEISVSAGQKKQKARRQPANPSTGNEAKETVINDKSSNNKTIVVNNPPAVSPKIDQHADNKTAIPVADTKPLDKTAPVADNADKKQPKPIALTDEKKAENVVTKNQKPAKKSNFFFAVSAAPDISFTGNDNPGTMKITAGAGIGYTYKGRVTLRTGFYTGRKIYTSSPAEYHMSSTLARYYPNLQKVGADCKVYEVPVLISYNFGAAKKHNWFASAGISSLFMKKETYQYFYKYNPAGPTVNRSYTIKNQNNHPFSIMTLSAGYQRSLTKHISFIAEPYFKVPLTGVGAGKVKLNSTGVSFTIAVSPFQPAKRK